MGHAQFAAEPEDHSHKAAPRGHGFDATAQSRHADMAAAIADCDVLLARGTLAPALRSGASAGVGAGAGESMRQAGIRPIVTDVASIDEAVQAYLTSARQDHVEKLH